MTLAATRLSRMAIARRLVRGHVAPAGSDHLPNEGCRLYPKCPDGTTGAVGRSPSVGERILDDQVLSVLERVQDVVTRLLLQDHPVGSRRWSMLAVPSNPTRLSAEWRADGATRRMRPDRRG